ncbi:hypothetical protein [Vibrio barjaei]|uniref:hypothetical protein n=1 Tax=Vibrio barjaei TaxID=1676683 RepID=UPI00228432D3|nr:hypothetical protein [Vibrio barjaei]MCY9873213.1 hypothetical protein [Vibrio barjaei]
MTFSLLEVGQNTKRNAMNSMATLADQEQKRNIANQELENQHKQGVVAGVGSGAAIGTAIMPGVGTGVGAVIGGLAAAIF